MSVADIFMPSVASLNAGITDPSFMSHGPYIVPLVPLVVQMAISRNREFGADATMEAMSNLKKTALAKLFSIFR